MLSNIIVASDGSEASERMIECVRGLARVGSQHATVVHVFNVRDVGGLYGSLLSMAVKKRSIMAGEKGPALRLRSGLQQSRKRDPLRRYFSGELSSEAFVFGAR